MTAKGIPELLEYLRSKGLSVSYDGNLIITDEHIEFKVYPKYGEGLEVNVYGRQPMKETGIIMSGDHPLKVLDGRKTMTRRTRGLDKINGDPGHWIKAVPVSSTDLWRFESQDGELLIVKCPYGHIGDLLWMKETWLQDYHGFHSYYADYLKPEPLVTLKHLEEGIRDGMYWKKPSIHMFRVYSRAEMLITGLRPERVQQIRNSDVLKEGVTPFPIGDTTRYKTGYPTVGIQNFKELWNSLNEKRGYGWEVNPWVWVIEFKRK